MRDLLLVFGACILSGLCGCAETDLEVNQSYADENIVCENLYQGDSVEDAVNFVGPPEDRRKACIASLKRRDRLAQGKELEFANRLFNTGRTRRAEDYASLLSRKMKELLAGNDKRSLLNNQMSEIRDGQAFGAPCDDNFFGKCDAKFVATFGDVNPEMLEDSNWYYFPDKPTHQLGFFHFHKPSYSLIGAMHYLIEDNGDYKLVVASLRDKDAPEYESPKRVTPVAVSGIEEKEVYVLGGKPHEQWHVGLTAADNKNNMIEIVMATETAGDAKSGGSEKSEKIIVNYDAISKYARVWDDVRFRFRVDFDSGGRQASNNCLELKYDFHVAASSNSGHMKYPGREITNINMKEEGVFENGRLELVSFDSTGEDGRVYRNNIFVRLTPTN